MSPSLWLFGFFALFGGWTFLSLVGGERQRRENEILAQKPPAPAESAPPMK